jgi:hypothetical protein
MTTPTLVERIESFQSRVQPWMIECFGAEISRDKIERNHRFLEEALELVQANGCTQSEAHQLVDYVYGRPQGEINQEAGGVMVTLAALCLASDIDMHAAGETELARIWTKVDAIRAKQAAKPRHSPLPAPPAAPARVVGEPVAFGPDSVKWVVNSYGELGVEVFGRYFFLYKGESLEYEEPTDDDLSAMRVRLVGKREFGETVWPVKWIESGRRQSRYDEPLTWGLGCPKEGQAVAPEDGGWKDLPKPTDSHPAAGVPDDDSPWRFVKIKKLDDDNWLVEIPGMASAVSSVMSHNPREMLLASLAELIGERGPPRSSAAGGG